MKITYMGEELQPRVKGKFSTKSKLAKAWAYFYLVFKVNTGALIIASLLIAIGHFTN